MSRRSFLFCLGIFIGVQLMALQSAAYNNNQSFNQQTENNNQSQDNQASSFPETFVPPESTPYSTETRGGYDSQGGTPQTQSPYYYPNYGEPSDTGRNQDQNRPVNRTQGDTRSANPIPEYTPQASTEYPNR
ncbi:MAG TPA: hypothetical protein VN457_03370 [Chlamydiales bacterium]|nr:hypothetical protein [Chlamydiales bacterium]